MFTGDQCLLVQPVFTGDQFNSRLTATNLSKLSATNEGLHATVQRRSCRWMKQQKQTPFAAYTRVCKFDYVAKASRARTRAAGEAGVGHSHLAQWHSGRLCARRGRRGGGHVAGWECV